MADLLRGDYKPHDYGQVILPLTVLRRMDCVLDPTKEAVLAAAVGLTPEAAEVVLPRITELPFYNTSALDFQKLLADPNHIAAGLRSYVSAFSPEARATFESFKFEDHIEYLDKQELLYLLIQKFAAIDLHPDVVANTEMGSIFEELIRKFSEQSNETAGEHFTPRDVVKLMVDLLVTDDTDLLTKGSIVKTILDPACGTGGMLSVAAERLFKLNPEATLVPFGEELNPETWAICSADMMMKGARARSSRATPSARTGLPVSGTTISCAIRRTAWSGRRSRGRSAKRRPGSDLAGGSGPAYPGSTTGRSCSSNTWLPSGKGPGDGGIADGDHLQRLAPVHGGPGSGESEIRRWVIENDWLEAIVGLPDQLFYNTGISTYIWILTNRKRPERMGAVQLINATGLFTKRRKSLGQQTQTSSRMPRSTDRAAARRFPGGQAVEDLRQRGFGVPPDHCGALTSVACLRGSAFFQSAGRGDLWRRIFSRRPTSTARSSFRRRSIVSSSLSRASLRLRACDRESCTVTRKPEGKWRNVTAVDTLLTFWPPGPPDRAKISSSSDSRMPSSFIRCSTDRPIDMRSVLIEARCSRGRAVTPAPSTRAHRENCSPGAQNSRRVTPPFH